MRRMSYRAALAASLYFFLCCGSHAATTTLFDDSLGSLPSEQGALLFGGFGGTETVLPGVGAVFNSTGLGNFGQHGYTNGLPLTLERTTGISLDFKLQITLEEHANTNRAGFSVIVVTSDLQAVELDFWQNEIWAQKVGFTHAEGAAYDTTMSLTGYSLKILGSGYSLFANGDTSPLFSGALRDLSRVASIDVYAVPHFLFFGDNSGSGRSIVNLGDISLTTSLVPLPPSLGLMLMALGGLALRRRTVDAG